MAHDSTEDLKKQSTVKFEVEISETPTRHVHQPTEIPNKTLILHSSAFSKFSFLHLGYRNPPPPKASLDDADVIPEANANWLSLLTFEWATPLMRLGYSRPLEATDLYKLQDDRSSGVIAERITRSFKERQRKAAEYNSRLANGEISPGLKGIWWSIRGQRQELEKDWREKTGQKKASFILAVNDSVFRFFWTGGIMRLISDVALITSPLLVKVIVVSSLPRTPLHLYQAIIRFAQHSYVAHRTGQVAPPLGRGIGLSLGLFSLQLLSSLTLNHFFYRSAGTGVLLRAGLITAIYNKALTLSTRARHIHSNGKLVNHISTDVSRVDFAAQFFHASWTAPVQLTICLVILFVNLGPSALAGFAVFIMMVPIQTGFMRALIRFRQSSVVFTDKRAKLLQELLSSIKIIKFFAWEDPYLARIHQVRGAEVKWVYSVSVPNILC